MTFNITPSQPVGSNKRGGRQYASKRQGQGEDFSAVLNRYRVGSRSYTPHQREDGFGQGAQPFYRDIEQSDISTLWRLVCSTNEALKKLLS